MQPPFFGLSWIMLDIVKSQYVRSCVNCYASWLTRKKSGEIYYEFIYIRVDPLPFLDNIIVLNISSAYISI